MMSSITIDALVRAYKSIRAAIVREKDRGVPDGIMDDLTASRARLYAVLDACGALQEIELKARARKAKPQAPSGVLTAHNSGVSTLPIAPIMPTIGSSQSKIEQVFEMYESAYSVQDMNGSIWERFLDAYSALDVNEQGLLYNKLCEFYNSNPPWGFSEVSE
jgi:hypothetical protein